MPNSRNIGATFERKVARELLLLTGVTFRRDLEQYRSTDRGDLLPDDTGWPFTIECKRRAGGGWQDAWWQQVSAAALAAGKFPAVVWQIGRGPVRVRVQCATLRPGLDHHCDLCLEGFAALASELMAEAAA